MTETDHSIILTNRALVDDVPAEAFLPEYWAKQAVKPKVLGRGNVSFIRLNGIDCVLKHYQRGGAVRHLVKQTYWYLGLEATRMWQEYHLLLHMGELHLPVPQPVAVRCLKLPRARFLPTLFYRGDLITTLISNTSTLADWLLDQPLSPLGWIQIGRTLRRFHDANVYHADLNANNILLRDESAVFLIDFDKSRLMEKSSGSAWKSANLARLQRSLIKIRNHQRNKPAKQFRFDIDNWSDLLMGYNEP